MAVIITVNYDVVGIVYPSPAQINAQGHGINKFPRYLGMSEKIGRGKTNGRGYMTLQVFPQRPGVYNGYIWLF